MAMRFRWGGGFIRNHFGLVFGGIWMAAGLPFVIGGIAMWQTELRFEQEAVTTEGRVLTRKIKTVRNSGNSGSSTEYWVSYRFQRPDSVVIEGSGQVDEPVWERLQERGPVTVAYLPDDPSSNRVAGEKAWFGALFMTFIGGFFTLAGGAIVAFTLGKRIARGRLMRQGMSAEAVVTSVAPSNFSINRVPQWIIHYRYHDHRGREHTGKSPYLTPEEAQAWKEGNTGKVKYDRERSAKSLWLGQG